MACSTIYTFMACFHRFLRERRCSTRGWLQNVKIVELVNFVRRNTATAPLQELDNYLPDVILRFNTSFLHFFLQFRREIRATLAVFQVLQVPLNALVNGWVFGHRVCQMPFFVDFHGSLLILLKVNVINRIE